jgi:shikimate dehydrogenase
VGRNISYSFSPGYFKAKFDSLGLSDCSYEVFDLPEISRFPEVASQNDLCGLNVTIPYKTAVLPFLDRLDPDAARIGAVNTIRVTETGLEGYNTDLRGFMDSLSPMLSPSDRAALILGTGGASRAVAQGLSKLGISHQLVSRSPREGELRYSDLIPSLLAEFQIVVNCTPLGTFPGVDQAPPIPYDALTQDHLLYDLIYNPERTLFLQRGIKAGCRIKNGLEMLHIQAGESWKIWNMQPGDSH